jgi:hypothetical protein
VVADGGDLGTLLRAEARGAGHGSDWRAYAAGRLLLPPGQPAPTGLLAEPVPGDVAEAAATAARWRLDPDLLWLIVRTTIDELVRSGRQGTAPPWRPGGAAGGP